MRRVFLWAARNRWLKERLPRLRFMRRAVRRFMPGETLDDALDRGRPARRRPASRRCTPGSARTSRAWPRRTPVADHYLERPRPDQGGRDRTARSRSSRPSWASTTTPTPASPTSSAWPSTRRPTGSYLWIDMEGSAYTEATIALYERLRAVQPQTGHLPAGVPPADGRRHRAAPAARPGDPPGQGRLRRAGGDRLPRQARRSTRTTLGLAVRSCWTAAAGRSGSGSARTTSRSSSRSPSRSAAPGSAATASRSRCCTASGRDEQRRLAKAGYRVRTLIAYGEHWYPWYMRRLAERPANVRFAIRSTLP